MPSGVVALSQSRGQKGVLALQGECRVTPGYTEKAEKAMIFPYA